MKPPAAAQISETANSKYWFEGELVCMVFKGGPEPPINLRIKQMEEFRQKLKGKKVCAVMDITKAKPASRGAREYNASAFPEIFKAIAFIITNPLSKMLVNLYVGARPLPFPVKMFFNEQEAREWIKQYQ